MIKLLLFIFILPVSQVIASGTYRVPRTPVYNQTKSSYSYNAAPDEQFVVMKSKKSFERYLFSVKKGCTISEFSIDDAAFYIKGVVQNSKLFHQFIDILKNPPHLKRNVDVGIEQKKRLYRKTLEFEITGRNRW